MINMSGSKSNRTRCHRVYVKTNGLAMHQVNLECIVTGPNIDMAIKLKNIFKTRLGLHFQNRETVLELNGCTIEAYPSNHIDSFRSLDNPKFILLDESDFWRE